MRTAYNYSPVTHEYIGASLAVESPLEPGVILLPAHGTLTPPPPTGANEAAVYDAADVWSIQPDYRGVSLYSTIDGSDVTVTEIGPQPADTTDQPRPSADYDWDGAAWAVNLARLQTRAAADIDTAAGAARARYITTVPGQEATYLIKAQQARDYQAAGYAGTVPVLVQSEADATGETAPAACDRILAEEATWIALAAQIETIRRRGKVVVQAATDAAGVAAARDDAVAQLGAI